MILDTVQAMDRTYIDHGILLVDQRRGERAFMEKLKKDLRASAGSRGNADFSKIAARPDHRDDTQLIQIADMFAGDVRRHEGDIGQRLGNICTVRT